VHRRRAGRRTRRDRAPRGSAALCSARGHASPDPASPMTPRSLLRNPRSALGAILVLALLIRIDLLGWSLPSVHEEGMALKKAWEMWGFGSVWGFGPPRGFDPNPHWFQYPSLMMYLQLGVQALLFATLRLFGVVHSALDLRALYVLDKTPFYLAGRALTVCFGVATILPVWSLARRAAGVPAAILAASFVAFHMEL